MTILHVRAESDDLASFSDSFYRDVSSDSVINLKDSMKELDRNKGIRNSIQNIKLKVDENGRKRAPNLFLFKKLPSCLPNSTEYCKQRRARNSQFMLVDTIYREEYKKIAHATTKEQKQHEDKTIHTNDDISDNIENNGEIDIKDA